MQLLRLEVRECRPQLLLWTKLLSALAIASSAAEQPNGLAWKQNHELYAISEYSKILGQYGENSSGQDGMVPYQYRYVDFEPKCNSGGQPVCATNGSNYFYFENHCKLDAANMKSLYQYGTEMEPTEMEHCQPQCETMRCNASYAPVCAAAKQGSYKSQAVTFANECEAHRRGCQIKQEMIILKKGMCAPAGSKAKSRRRHGKRRLRERTSSTAAPPLTGKQLPKKLGGSSTSTTTPSTTSTSTTSTTTTSIPNTMQLQRFLHHPDVSVSQPVNAYSVYNMPDMDYNYADITDSNESFYIPGVGTVTDTPPSNIPSTAAVHKAPKEHIQFIYQPYRTTSRTSTTSRSSTTKRSGVTSAVSISTSATIADTIPFTTIGPTLNTTLPTKFEKIEPARNATGFKPSRRVKLIKPLPKPSVSVK